MMRDCFLLDSNICVYLLKDLVPVLSARVREQVEGSLFISAITLAEVGFGVSADFEQSAALDRFLRDVAVVPFDAAAAGQYARLSFKRDSFDRLIAAHALALDITLVTNNETDFVNVAGLRVENWTVG